MFGIDCWSRYRGGLVTNVMSAAPGDYEFTQCPVKVRYRPLLDGIGASALKTPRANSPLHFYQIGKILHENSAPTLVVAKILIKLVFDGGRCPRRIALNGPHIKYAGTRIVSIWA